MLGLGPTKPAGCCSQSHADRYVRWNICHHSLFGFLLGCWRDGARPMDTTESTKLDLKGDRMGSEGARAILHALQLCNQLFGETQLGFQLYIGVRCDQYISAVLATEAPGYLPQFDRRSWDSANCHWVVMEFKTSRIGHSRLSSHHRPWLDILDLMRQRSQHLIVASSHSRKISWDDKSQLENTLLLTI